ncbi:MAG TPA: hypothetical protein VFC47_03220 [Caulobacteraceae bacterium]|nr:hypothetical protein [Caulobacteraceae bacterium]
MPPTFGPRSYGLIIGLAVVVGVMLLRNSRPRTLRVERLWIRPMIFLALLATTLAAAPPPLTPIGMALLAAALIVGCALGWLRGRSMRIEVHPRTHDVTSRASPVGMVFILALVVLRLEMRGAAVQSPSVIGVPATTATSALILLAVGMMVTQAIEMWLRSRRLLAEAQAAPSPGGTPIVR